jgi:hypothetical protein
MIFGVTFAGSHLPDVARRPLSLEFACSWTTLVGWQRQVWMTRRQSHHDDRTAFPWCVQTPRCNTDRSPEWLPPSRGPGSGIRQLDRSPTLGRLQMRPGCPTRNPQGIEIVPPGLVVVIQRHFDFDQSIFGDLRGCIYQWPYDLADDGPLLPQRSQCGFDSFICSIHVCPRPHVRPVRKRYQRSDNCSGNPLTTEVDRTGEGTSLRRDLLGDVSDKPQSRTCPDPLVQSCGSVVLPGKPLSVGRDTAIARRR